MNENLPVNVREYPHWRVLFRPAEYAEDKLTLAQCLAQVEKNQVNLRGWPFPPLSQKPEGRGSGSNWFAAWSVMGGFGGHLEYWRIYQSGQFVYLGAVREKLESDWDQKIRTHLTNHLCEIPKNPEKIPGFLSLTSLVYLIAEYIEFASRLCESDVYSGALEIRVSLNRAKDFVLVSNDDWAPLSLFKISTEHLERVLQMDAIDLVSRSRSTSFEMLMWFLERFGWMNPPTGVLRDLHDNFLARGSR